MMPQISEITDAMNAPMDESATSTSLMISSSTPDHLYLEHCGFVNPTLKARVRTQEVVALVQADHRFQMQGGYHTEVRDLWFCQGLNMPRQRVPNP